jgi:hypothetical protein
MVYARPRYVEGNLVGLTEVVPGDSSSFGGDALEVLGARDGRGRGRWGPAKRGTRQGIRPETAP